MSEKGNCAICRRQESKENPHLVVFEDDLWIARHSLETNILGYLILESKRHFLDLSHATKAERQSLGLVLGEMEEAVRKAVSPERLYTFTLAEVVPHFHVHLIPRTRYLPKAYRGRGVLSYPLTPAADPNLMEQLCTNLKRFLSPAHLKL